MGPVPPPDVAGSGHPTRRGPDGGVPWGWRNPTIRLSLSLFPFCVSPYFPSQVPCRRGSSSPASMERRTGTGVGGRESPRQGGGVSQPELRAHSRSSGVSTLREVLRALRGAGLTANPKKCAIGRVEVRYLGFHLGHGQVRPQIDKTAAIAACPRPKTKKEVRQFLGLAGYYRRFVPDYSELTSPLTDLTKKEVPDTVPWTERCQQVFTQVKAALCGGPLLHSPDFSLPFLLQTDASDRGLGAVLTQEIGGEERPVLYISRKLSKRETMYSTIEKECLAIRWAVLTLRYYLLGREFTLCSDHAPLQWLHRMKDTNARITRWYLALQPFKFKVIHRPGTQMTVADFLSRNGGGGGCRPEGFPA